MRLPLKLAVAAAGFASLACGGEASAPATLAQSPTSAATATVTVPGVATDGPAQAATPSPSPAPSPGPSPDPGAVELAAVEVARGISRPTYVTHAGDGSGRLFVVEKAGRIRIIAGGQVLAEPFLDIRDLVTDSGNEQGLLGLAFHPRYPQDPRFFVAYTAAGGGANTLAEFRVSAADPDRADPSSLRVLIAIPDTRSNHNGGMVAFGPDGYLYLSTGDGGGAGDPDRAGQDLGTLMGKILRIDVDAGDPYGIPPGNPFVGREGARPEIWAFGLRNPWRFSFDRATGDLWIADVGQNEWEEINFQPAASPGGENYGWSILEGSHCFRPATGCDPSGTVLPIHEYDHSQGCSVTGGYVYRGAAIPLLRGAYIYADYCAGNLIALTRTAGGGAAATPLGIRIATVSSFGEGEAGEIYVVSDSGGRIYRLIAE
jgi:glucose/arabinose dehydrogenase